MTTAPAVYHVPSTNGHEPIRAFALPSLLPGQLHETGIDLPPNLTFDEWAASLRNAEWIEAASPWWVVSLVEYGRRFNEDISQAFPTFEEDPTGIRQAKLKQASWMASAWPEGTRVPGMSYSHHRTVAHLDRPEAQALLREALAATDEDGNSRPWSTRELKRRVDDRDRAVPADAIVVDAEPVLWPADLPPPEPAPVEPPSDIGKAWLLIADLAVFLQDQYLTRRFSFMGVATYHDRHCEYGKPGKSTCSRRCLDAWALIGRAELT